MSLSLNAICILFFLLGEEGVFWEMGGVVCDMLCCLGCVRVQWPRRRGWLRILGISIPTRYLASGFVAIIGSLSFPRHRYGTKLAVYVVSL